MLTPDEYDHLCDRLTELYADLENSIIEDIVRRMMKTGRVTESARWQAELLQESGLLYEDVLASIASRTDATVQHVRALFEDAGVQCIRNDNRRYKAAGLEGVVKMSDAALQTLNAGYRKCAGELQNLTLTTANTSQTAYLNACDLAYMQVSTGMLDYGTAIRRAVRSVGADGVHVLYPSGHRDKLDVAARRSVLTGVGQTVRTLSEINAQDMGCDLMELTAHAGARPSHAAWQGQVVSLSGRKGYLSKSDIGYGTGDGFGGWNCRHDWYPFFEGISKRAYEDADLKALNEKHIEIDGKKYTDYEISQMQRALEREIRSCKRQVMAANMAVECAEDAAMRQTMQEEFAQQSVKLKAAEKELKTFLDKVGFLPDDTRVWVNGFGRSVSQKAVWANKKALNNLTNKDFGDIIGLKGKLSSRDVRQWYVTHDKMIPDLIDRTKSIEEQARQAFELRNMFRTQARDLMIDQKARKQLDKTDPNRSFEELIDSKMRRKNMTREEAIDDILSTATKTRASVNKKFGLE